MKKIGKLRLGIDITIGLLILFGLSYILLRPIYDQSVQSNQPDDRVAFYTALLAVVTTVLALVSATQIFFLFSADETAKISANAAKDSADAAISATQLSEKQFNNSYPPRLRVRHVTLGPEDRARQSILNALTKNDFIVGNLTLVNAGGVPAKILKSQHGIYLSEDAKIPPAMPVILPDNFIIPKGVTLQVGETASLMFRIQAESKFPYSIHEPRYDLPEWMGIFFLAQFVYLDQSGVERYMGICRQMSRDGRFEIVDHPDYEFQD